LTAIQITKKMSEDANSGAVTGFKFVNNKIDDHEDTTLTAQDDTALNSGNGLTKDN